MSLFDLDCGDFWLREVDILLLVRSSCVYSV